MPTGSARAGAHRGRRPARSARPADPGRRGPACHPRPGELPRAHRPLRGVGPRPLLRRRSPARSRARARSVGSARRRQAGAALLSSPAGGEGRGHRGLDPSGRARFRLRLDRLATRALLPSYLRPLLGGTAHGWIAARGELPRTSRASFLRDGRFVLEGVDFTLTRERCGPLPRTVRLFTGKLPDPRLSLPGGPGSAPRQFGRRALRAGHPHPARGRRPSRARR